ncbi:hypothetical protein ONO86_05004 [Micromonospora noduli]|nr:hypothetical protein ONO86_05004 [Micromonospora noduli]
MSRECASSLRGQPEIRREVDVQDELSGAAVGHNETMTGWTWTFLVSCWGEGMGVLILTGAL